MTGEVPTVLVVMGVSGSGKSTIASMLARRLGWEYEDGDWFHPQANVDKMAAGTPLADEDRWPWLAAIAAWIDELHAAGGHGVVACSALKRAYRDALVRGRPDIVRIVYLEGSKELIGARMALRENHFMPAALLDSQFRTLEPPAPDEQAITVSVAPRPKAVAEAVHDALEREIGGTIPIDTAPRGAHAPAARSDKTG